MRTNPLWIKICGATSPRDVEILVEAGVDAIGLNFAPGSPRRISIERARELVLVGGSAVEWVGVFVDAGREELERTRDEVGLDFLQLHGVESPELLHRFLPRAFKALRIGDAEDVRAAREYGGTRVLVDAKVAGDQMGGTGVSFDWSLLGSLVEERELVLAGGLRPDNVAVAVSRVRPFGVDTASGVENAPGVKDREKVRAFVRAAREAQ